MLVFSMVTSERDMNRVPAAFAGFSANRIGEIQLEGWARRRRYGPILKAHTSLLSLLNLTFRTEVLIVF